MTPPLDPEGDRERARFLDLLRSAEAQSRTITFWWRDDDAETVTPALDQMLALAGRHALPLALAAIPKRAAESLAGRLAEEPRIAVFQHGWRHRNHSPEDEKKAELGDHRPLPEVLDELKFGFDRLGALFPESFLPVLVPPWNRIGDAVREARRTLGLVGLSTIGPAPAGDPHWVNAHLDIMEWRPARRPLPRREAYALLSGEVERRLGGDHEPIGILTHHLVHEEAAWDFLEELFGLIAGHPAVTWPETRELFAL